MLNKNNATINIIIFGSNFDKAWKPFKFILNSWTSWTSNVWVIYWTGSRIKQPLVDDYVAWWRIHFSDLVFNCTYLNWCCRRVCISDVGEHIAADCTRNVHQVERSYLILFSTYIHIELKWSRNHWYWCYQWIIEWKHTTRNCAGWIFSNPNWRV